MTKSKRLEPVSRIAENRERRAAVEMAEFKRFLDAQQAKLDELQRYRGDYARQFEQAGRQGLDAARMADFRRILNHLAEAIAWQERRLVSLRQDFEQIRKRWTDTRTRTAALAKVVERYQAEERREAEQREQRDLDDRSQGSAATGRPGESE
jgi:flagellar FliJ protein